jgi:hypothetical protein
MSSEYLPGLSIRVKEIFKEAVDMYRRGDSIRDVSRAFAISKATAMRIRRICGAKATCQCGQQAGHRGWCWFRYERSPVRQAAFTGRLLPESPIVNGRRLVNREELEGIVRRHYGAWPFTPGLLEVEDCSKNGKYWLYDIRKVVKQLGPRPRCGVCGKKRVLWDNIVLESGQPYWNQKSCSEACAKVISEQFRKDYEDKKCLRNGRRMLKEIKEGLASPRGLEALRSRVAESRRDQTSPTACQR